MVHLQLALIVPYMRIGEWLTGAPHVELGPVGIKDLIKHGSGGERTEMMLGLDPPNSAPYCTAPWKCKPALLPAPGHCRLKFVH